MILNILSQAQTAAQQKDWSLVNQYLQQLITTKSEKNADTASQLTTAELEQVLYLALEVLNAGDFQQRWDVVKVFPKLGENALAPLITIMQDEDAEIELRWFAGRILAGFNHPTVVTSLIELVKTTEDEELVEMARTALTNLGSSAIDALTNLLAEEESRLLAVRSLAQIRSSQTIAPLLTVVKDQNVIVRATAIEALSSFHDARIPPVLLSALQDLAAPVRKEAVVGLGLRPDVRDELDLVNHIKPLLYDFNIDVCGCAAIALGRLGTDNAVTALFEILKSPATPEILQLTVVRALAWINTSYSLDCLGQGLTSTPAVSQEIIMQLGRIEKPLKSQAADILIEFINSEQLAQQTSLKNSLALALGQLGEIKAIDPLIQLLADFDSSVQFHAIAALKTLAPQQAHQQLQQLAADTQLSVELKQGIAIALQEW
ncbi:MAG TPA: HEAT repeat domain-containing protein [Oculatellaceae cyanobacterium]|jgi:HEAT repeat protein